MPGSSRTTARSILALLLFGALAGTANAAPPQKIIFPVIGPVQYTDDFGAPRPANRHQGNDLMAPRGAPLVAVEPGRVTIYRGSSRAGCMLYLHGRSGTKYLYIHLNDDLTARDDNRARDCRVGVAYAPGLRNNQRVRAGQLIGYVGNSGDAAGGAPHLHFELHPQGRGAVSPYRWLRRAQRLLYAVPARVTRTRLALFGTVTKIDDRVTVRTNRIAVAFGWRGKTIKRGVTLGRAPELAVERLHAKGGVGTAALANAKPGEKVTVWTTWFRPTLATQRARPEVLSAQRVRLRGDG